VISRPLEGRKRLNPQAQAQLPQCLYCAEFAIQRQTEKERVLGGTLEALRKAVTSAGGSIAQEQGRLARPSSDSETKGDKSRLHILQMPEAVPHDSSFCGMHFKKKKRKDGSATVKQAFRMSSARGCFRKVMFTDHNMCGLRRQPHHRRAVLEAEPGERAGDLVSFSAHQQPGTHSFYLTALLVHFGTNEKKGGCCPSRCRADRLRGVVQGRHTLGGSVDGRDLSSPIATRRLCSRRTEQHRSKGRRGFMCRSCGGTAARDWMMHP